MEMGDKYIHSWAVEDASYLRLSNLSLGYTFDRKKLRKFNVQSLRLYFTGSNLFVWTPYSGFDPEVSTKGNSLIPVTAPMYSDLISLSKQLYSHEKE